MTSSLLPRSPDANSASVRSSADAAFPVFVWDIIAPLSEVLYLIEGANLTSTLSGFSHPLRWPIFAGGLQPQVRFHRMHPSHNLQV